MNKIFSAFSLVAVFALNAQAGILSSNLSFNGIADLIVDQSRSNLVDNGDGVLSVGDIVYGYLNFDERSLDGGGNANISGGELTALFAVEISNDLGLHPSGFGKVFEHKAATGFLTSLLDAALVAEGVGGAAFDASTIAIIVESTTSVDPENVATSLGFFTGAAWDAVATVGKLASTDFFQIRDLGLLFGGSAQEAASLSVLQTSAAAGLPSPSAFLSNVGADVLTDTDAAFDTFGQVALRDGTIFPNTNTDNGSWVFNDRTNFAINAVPEPTSLLAFAGLFGFGAVGFRRRGA